MTKYVLIIDRLSAIPGAPAGIEASMVGGRGALMSVATATFFAMLATTVVAEFTPAPPIDLPEAVPGDGCEWFGYGSYGVRVDDYSLLGWDAGRSTEEIGWVSSQGTGCAASWRQVSSRWLLATGPPPCPTRREITGVSDYAGGALMDAHVNPIALASGEDGWVALVRVPVLASASGSAVHTERFTRTECNPVDVVTETPYDGYGWSWDVLYCPSGNSQVVVSEHVQSFLYSCSEVDNDTGQVITIAAAMRRTDCDVSVDSDGDGVGDCDEFTRGTSASSTDTDGDGIPDGQDTTNDENRPDWFPGGDGAGGGGGGGEDEGGGGGCGDRGYTATHYDADLAFRFLPDVDFFDWEVFAKWCVVDGRAAVSEVDSQGYVTLDPVVGTGLEIIGVTFREDPDDPANFLISSPGLVSASTDFEMCVSPIALASGGLGSALRTGATQVGRRVLGAMPRSGSVDDLVAGAVARAAGNASKIEQSTRRALLKAVRTANIPTPLKDLLRLSADDAARLVGEEMAEGSLAGVSTDALSEFLGRFGVAGQIVIPRSERKLAQQMWKDAQSTLTNGVIGVVTDALGYTTCQTVWRPVLEIHIPADDSSYVDEAHVDGSIFKVTGGITEDTRP